MAAAVKMLTDMWSIKTVMLSVFTVRIWGGETKSEQQSNLSVLINKKTKQQWSTLSIISFRNNGQQHIINA